MTEDDVQVNVDGKDMTLSASVVKRLKAQGVLVELEECKHCGKHAVRTLPEDHSFCLACGRKQDA